MMMSLAVDPSAAKIEVKISKQGEQNFAELKLVPKVGTVFNKEAPWELSVENPPQPTLKFAAKDFDFEKGIFKFQISGPQVKVSDLGIKLVYFVCNAEKTWCKRLVFKNRQS
jgi:hypothetical protein